jgi:methylenetetrahydrofolate reductase (NADPH)
MSARSALIADASMEMTGKDVPGLAEARDLIPGGTRINVTYLGNEDPQIRLDAARAVREAGFIPVPHISARRVSDEEALREFLAALRSQQTSSDLFVIGGDPATAEGPYNDALSLISSGILGEYGVESVGISGYPEGHPHISDDALWHALTSKVAVLEAAGLGGHITSQFGFDVTPVLAWIERVRNEGIELPIRVGVPGPAGIKRLMGYATRFGVTSSAGIARKYGMSLTNLLGTAGPDRFIDELAQQIDPQKHGKMSLHFYTFGGLPSTSKWIRNYREGALR